MPHTSHARITTADVIINAEAYVDRAAANYSDIPESKRWDIVASSLNLGGVYSSRHDVVIGYLTDIARRSTRDGVKRTHIAAAGEYRMSTRTASTSRYPGREQMIIQLAWAAVDGDNESAWHRRDEVEKRLARLNDADLMKEYDRLHAQTHSTA